MTSVEAKLRLGQKVFIMFLSKRVRTKPMQTNLLPFLVRNEQKHDILGHYRYEYRTLYIYKQQRYQTPCVQKVA